MTRLIGTRCKHSNVLSRGVLIVRFLLGNLEIIYLLLRSSSFSALHLWRTSSIQFSDIIRMIFVLPAYGGQAKIMPKDILKLE